MDAKRNELIDRMVRVYGFENPIVIKFCKACEGWAQDEHTTHLLEVIVIAHEQFPIRYEGED